VGSEAKHSRSVCSLIEWLLKLHGMQTEISSDPPYLELSLGLSNSHPAEEVSGTPAVSPLCCSMKPR
jgi:hypothetical protein